MAVLRRRGGATFVTGVVSGAHFLSHVFLLSFPPLFPLLGREFGLSTTQLGALVTAIYVPTLLFQLPLGDLVDRLGARRILVAGMATTAGGITIAGFATSYPLLLASAFVSGIGQSVFHPADYALLGTVTDESNEGLAFSVHTFGGFVGFATAPLVVGGIALAHGWGVALVVVGVVGFAYAGLVHLTVEAVHTRTTDAGETDGPALGTVESVRRTVRSVMRFARRREMLLVSCFYLLFMMAIVGLQSFTTILAVETFGFAESTANALLTIHLAASALGVVAGGVLADRLPFLEVIIGVLLLAMVAVWALAVVPTPSLILVAVLLAVIGWLIGLALPARDKFGNAVADPTAVGKSFGVYFTGLSLGAVLSPILVGTAFDYLTSRGAFLFVGGFLGAAVGIVGLARANGVGDPAESGHEG